MEMMRERMRKALLGSAVFDDMPDQHLAPEIERAIDRLLAAMMEPDEGMIEAAVSEYIGDVDALLTWQAMLGAARDGH